MAELDVSLDDLIKSKKGSGRGGGRGGRGSGSGRGSYGPARRTGGRGAFRSAPYVQPAAMVTSGAWQHDMFDGAGAATSAAVAGAGAIETGTKLYISNLDFGVSNEDVKELFSEIGELKRCSIHYDRSGRSKGTAEVVFARKADALAAMSRYNNVQLDGKPMKIELIGSTVAPGAAASAPRVAVAPVVAPYAFVPAAGFPGGRGGRGLGRGRGGGGGRGAGRGRGRGRKNDKPQKTQEELDAELDQYNAKKDSMQS